MPSVHYQLRWPDGSVARCHSPSTVIKHYLAPHTRYPLVRFMELAREAYPRASERVREVYGYACSSAADQLEVLEREAARFADQPDAVVEVHDLA